MVILLLFPGTFLAANLLDVLGFYPFQALQSGASIIPG
jgi:hypothetical protein